MLRIVRLLVRELMITYVLMFSAVSGSRPVKNLPDSNKKFIPLLTNRSLLFFNAIKEYFYA